MVEEKDEESAESESAYKKSPIAMPFILFSVFIERFCSAVVSGEASLFDSGDWETFQCFGLSAVLALCFNVKLNLDPNLSTSLLHLHEFMAYSFTIIGAIIADSWWGQFKTITVMQLIYAIGTTVLSLGNVGPLNFSIP
jgi:hypothetical protein